MANSCIITGATGYIGSHVLRHFLSKGWDVHIVADPKFGYANIDDVLSLIDVFEYDGNINNLCNHFNSINADVVLHLAAAVITNYIPEQASVLIQSNIQFGTEILEAMKQSGTKLFVGTGSYWQNYNCEDYNPVDLYAATKEAFEKILKYYTEVENIRAITLRLYDVYGTEDRRPKLWNIIKQKAGSIEPLDMSEGEQLLDMVFISDVCTAYEQAYHLLNNDNQIKNSVYGVYSNRRKPLKEIVEIYRSMLNEPVIINYGSKPYKKREVMKPTDRLEVLPGWQPQVSLEEGLKIIANS
jgi:CDP-3, 6-dideoxy-D-glycero-L-glycero-4-hexulose-4-reductase